jgi:glycosyltransferase involved in cell wall biosynthesis
MKCWMIERPDIVLFSHVNLSPLGLAMRASHPTSKIVVIVYGDDVWGRLSRLRSLALAHADAIWSVSRYTRDVLVHQLGLPASKVFVLPLGLTAELLDKLGTGLREENDVSTQNGHSLLTVARLDPANTYKGIDHVIRSLPIVAQRVPAVTLTVVGDGTDRSRLESLAHGLGVGHRVRFLGAISDDDLAEAYRQCDVFTLPSAQEGFGLVFIEAMAAGKPVVAVDARATAEVVLPDRTGILVNYADVSALSEGLITLLTNESLRRQMGARARQLVEERFNFDRFAQQVGELLNLVLTSGKDARDAPA